MSRARSVAAMVTRGAHVAGIGLVLLGAVAVVLPGLAGAPVVILVGALLMLAGVARATFGWRAWSAGKGPLGFVIGTLAAACGIALVANPVSTLERVSLLLAAYFVVDGVAELLFAARLRDDEGRRWCVGDAALSVLLGASMWVGWPVSGLRALGILVGTKLIAAGAVILRVERGLRRAGRGLAELRTRFGS